MADALPHEAYFYALATVAITFAGFASILLALRQGRGAPLSRFHLWVAKAYIQSGLITAISAMLPPLLYGLGMDEILTWRACSLLIGLPALALLVTAPREWRRVSDKPVPTRLWVQIIFGVGVNLALLANAAGWPHPPAVGLVMLGVSWNLFVFFIQFAESVNFFFEEEP